MDCKIEPLVINNKSCKRYFVVHEKKVYFNADFDSGNLEKVQQIAPYIYKIYPGYDKTKFSTEKTFFHFKVCGFEKCTVRFQVLRVHILEKLLRMNQTHVYKPIVKKQKGKFEFIKRNVEIYYNTSDEVQLSFEYEFEHTPSQWIQFSFAFPYSYQTCLNLVKELKLKYIDHPQVYFHDQVITYTKEKRKVQLITVTERINCQKQRQQLCEGIFPDEEPRPFVINKPKVIITGRVHPGQTPASYCIEGLLRFLLDQKDYRSYLLRKNFHFLIIPILNPDGVYNGMFRSDMNGDNLNRVYVNCSRNKHPSIWGVRKFLQSLDKEMPAFFFDFHAHPSRKQFFIYGNAFSEITMQVEAETFGKLLENNCPYFHNIDSIFSEKQMGSKDRNDFNTKEGCGRVYVHRLFNLIHSYTVQCGYFAPGKLNPLIPVDPKRINSGDYCYVDEWEKCAKKMYKPESYMLMGKSILVTILDLFHLNPYTRLNSTQYRSIGNVRKAVAAKIYSIAERFRMMDANCPKKMRQLTLLIEENYYKERFGKYGLSVSENYGMQHAKRKFSLYSRLYLPKRFVSNEKRNSRSKSGDHKHGNNEQQYATHFVIEEQEIIEEEKNPFLQHNIKKQEFLQVEMKNVKHYKSEKKISNKKYEDLYQLCRIDKVKAMESLILQGENPKRGMKSQSIDKEKVQERPRKKSMFEEEQDFKKTRIDHFLKKQSKKYLPMINKKLVVQKNTIEKEKDAKNLLPSLIIQKTKVI